MTAFKLISSALLAAPALAFTSCADSTDKIGSDLIQVDNSIVVADEFTLEGSTVENNRVQSRTVTQLIGSIDAGDYGRFSADFVTQFMPAASLDTLITSKEQIDSLKMFMMFQKGSFVGDSVTPMGLEVYRLTKQLTAPIFSDFDPSDYYDPSKPLGGKIYTASILGVDDDSDNETSHNVIYVDMPDSMASEFYEIFTENKAAVQTPTAFAKIFPGVYVKNSYGAGRVTKIGATCMELFFHYPSKTSEDKDTILSTSTLLMQATPEIITNNNISYLSSKNISDRLADGQDLIVAPAGYDVEIKFPVEDIIKYYEEHRGDLSVVNTLTMSLPVELISNTYGINPPQYILMVKKKEHQEFFEKSKITDNKTSFYSEYSKLNNNYPFASLRQYFLDMLAEYEKNGSVDEDDYTFVLTPVSLELETNQGYYQTTTSVKTIAPYIDGPAMVRLRLDKAEIKLTFSNQSSL